MSFLPSPCQPLIYLCSYGLACSGHFVSMGSFVIGFFHWASCFQAPPMLSSYGWICHPFFVSSLAYRRLGHFHSGWLQIMLTWLFVCKGLCGHVFSVTLGVCLRVELLGWVETVQRSEEHPQRLHHFPFPPEPPVSLPPRQHLLLSVFRVSAVPVGVSISAVVWACVSLMTMMLCVSSWLNGHCALAFGEWLQKSLPVFNWVTCLFVVGLL